MLLCDASLENFSGRHRMSEMFRLHSLVNIDAAACYRKGDITVAGFDDVFFQLPEANTYLC